MSSDVASGGKAKDNTKIHFLARGHVFGVEHLLGQLRNLYGFSD